MAIAFTGDLASAQTKRVALVIGMSDYLHAPRLTNTLNDAGDMAEALKRLDFKVIIGRNLDKTGLDRIVREFANELRGADVGLFYYAGHAVQIEGQNHMIPVDAKLDREAAIDFEATRLDLVHRTMEREAKTNILFLDACRDNPMARNLARSLGTRSTKIGHGLATFESGEGTLIAFSTQPGNVALDGDGRNSPYTAALLRHISSPGEDLSSILIKVRNDVMRETERRQVPWEHSALTARFFFKPADPKDDTRQVSQEEVLWESIKGSKSPSAYELYLERFPNGRYVLDARAELERLKPKQDAKRATEPTSLSPTPTLQETDPLFTSKDRAQVEALARKHRFILPPFDFAATNRQLPDKYRRFIGVWVDEFGFKGKGRRNMIILVAADASGRLQGFQLFGPADETSFDQNPPGSNLIDTSIEGNGFRYLSRNRTSSFQVRLSDNNDMHYTFANTKGQTTSRSFKPVWRLIEAQAKAGR